MQSKTIDLTRQYGCPACMTVAYFTIYGVPHVARRFWRSDLPGTGKIELYTYAPGITRPSVTDEDWLGYANEAYPTRVDVAAMVAVASVEGSGYLPTAPADAARRAAAIEL